MRITFGSVGTIGTDYFKLIYCVRTVAKLERTLQSLILTPKL